MQQRYQGSTPQPAPAGLSLRVSLGKDDQDGTAAEALRTGLLRQCRVKSLDLIRFPRTSGRVRSRSVRKRGEALPARLGFVAIR